MNDCCSSPVTVTLCFHCGVHFLMELYIFIYFWYEYSRNAQVDNQTVKTIQLYGIVAVIFPCDMLFCYYMYLYCHNVLNSVYKFFIVL